MRNTFLLMMVALAAFILSCSQANNPADHVRLPDSKNALASQTATIIEPADLTWEEYLQQVKSDKLVLVDFTAVWCGPCKQQKPIVEKIAAAHNDILLLMTVDVDKNPTVSNTLKVQYIPTLILYKNGEQKWRNSGLIQESEIMNVINQYK